MRKIYLLIGAALLAGGCVKTEAVSEDNLVEVAADDIGVSTEDLKNLQIVQEDNSYTISFDLESGTYTYTIGTNGIISGRQFTAADKSARDTSGSDETSASEKNVVESSGILPPGQIDVDWYLAAALAHTGLDKDDVTDITCEDNGDATCTLTFMYGKTKNIFIIDMNTATVKTTYFE